jgi:uncharacterized protein (TIGR02284 family)
MDRNDVISTLNDLIETCKDGEEGFLACAQSVKNPALKSFLEEKAQRCATGAMQLRAKVRELGGDPERSGSTAGAMHRAWVNIKSAVTGMDDQAVLAECERGEDVAKRSYEKALQQDLPGEVRSIVQAQYQEVKANHDRVRDMRNAAV